MASERSAKDATMAAHLKSRGIFHGKRLSTTHAPPIPVKEAGSAAYRRMQAKKR